jgi:hypothetical protein
MLQNISFSANLQILHFFVKAKHAQLRLWRDAAGRMAAGIL